MPLLRKRCSDRTPVNHVIHAPLHVDASAATLASLAASTPAAAPAATDALLVASRPALRAAASLSETLPSA